MCFEQNKFDLIINLQYSMHVQYVPTINARRLSFSHFHTGILLGFAVTLSKRLVTFD